MTCGLLEGKWGSLDLLLHRQTQLLDKGAQLDTRRGNNQAVLESQEEPAQGGRVQGLLGLEGRRLRENVIANVKYKKHHYMGEESHVCGLLEGQWVGLQGSRTRLSVRKNCLNHLHHPIVEGGTCPESDFHIIATVQEAADQSLFAKCSRRDSCIIV